MILNGVRTKLFSPGTVAPMNLDASAGFCPALPGVCELAWSPPMLYGKGTICSSRRRRSSRDLRLRFYMWRSGLRDSRKPIVRSRATARYCRIGARRQDAVLCFQQRTAAVYAALDIVVHASTRPEPFGRTLAEAMASGRSVVAARAGGVLEQVHHGMNGLLFTPGRPAEFAAALRELSTASELRSRMSAEALCCRATPLRRE